MALTRKERTLGCLWAMACGDALGVPSSFLTPEQIKSKYGWIDTFYPPEKGHIFHDGLLAGEYTDDTEQSMALMNAYIRDKKVVPMSVVKEIIAWADRVKDKYASPLGPSTERALKNIAAGGDITVSGKWGNTNGSSMRIAPLGIIHGLRGSTLQELARDVLAIAERGLKARARPGAGGLIADETHFLNALHEIVAAGQTSADEMLLRFHEAWDGDLSRIYGDYSY